MPKTSRPKPERKNIRIIVPLLDEIDKILKKFPMYGNRQRFIETVIQEKIEEAMRLNLLQK
jgi:metal-responsive CopG/Arc/MetJ family transcriptional regulator